MDSHPVPYEQLIAYAAVELDENVISRVAKHIKNCVECATTVLRFNIVWTILRTDDTQAPPPRTLVRAQAIFTNHRVSNGQLG